MQTEYPWLDPERRAILYITTHTVHPLCICRWNRSKDENQEWIWLLTVRNRRCRLHGVDGAH